MLKRILSLRLNPESVRKSAQEFGLALVVLGTLGLILEAVSVWVWLNAFVAGVVAVYLGSSGKA